MGRLTARGNRGYASLKGTSCRYSHVSYDCQIEEGRSKLEEALEKLASYEDIIDDPEKLKLIDALYLERCEEINRLKAELTEYKKLEGKGLLLQLPCREVFESNGDIVYYIFDYEIAECINCGISIDCDGKMWIALACDEHIFPYRNPDPEHDLDPTDWCINTTQVTVDEWGKTVFLTKEEAQQALERMKEVRM